jgi:hypothetical protein
MEEILRRELDLESLIVLTEAAAHAYGITPVSATRAGAGQVCATNRHSRFGLAQEAAAASTNWAASMIAPSQDIAVRFSRPGYGLPGSFICSTGTVCQL